MYGNQSWKRKTLNFKPAEANVKLLQYLSKKPKFLDNKEKKGVEVMIVYVLKRDHFFFLMGVTFTSPSRNNVLRKGGPKTVGGGPDQASIGGTYFFKGTPNQFKLCVFFLLDWMPSKARSLGLLRQI